MSNAKAKFLSVYPSCLELAVLMKENTSLIEKALVLKAVEMFAIHTDAKLKESFLNFYDLKLETLRMLVEDMAMGAPALRASAIGLQLKEGRIEPYIAPYGTSVPGKIIYSIEFKDSATFGNLRGAKEDLSAETIDLGIYFLTVQISKLIY